MRSSNTYAGTMTWIMCAGLVLLAISCCPDAAAQSTLPRDVFGAGAIDVSGGGFAVLGTLGQPIIGFARNSQYAASQGFWYNASRTGVDVEAAPPGQPAVFNLDVYPNPAHSRTTVSFDLRQRTNVSVYLYDVLGKLIATPVAETLEQGEYRIPLDLSPARPGLYILKVRYGSRVKTTRIAVVR